MRPLAATIFVLAHVILMAGAVPLANLVPASLGALALTAMALSLVLAARWPLVDRLTGGPDKSYVLHRYLGFFTLFGTLGHWALASDLGAGMIPALGDAAEGAGTLAATGLLGLSAAAMVRALPYHLWKASHALMGPVFLIGLFHTLFTAGPVAMGTLPWAVLAGAGAIGTLAWARTLLRRTRQGDAAVVSRVDRFEGGVDVTLSSTTPLPAFRAGQFAQVRHDGLGGETHPFTIAGGDETTRRLVIRDSGDWTRRFARQVRVGDKMHIGLGEGRFLPQTGAQRRPQMWLAGGVGVTPFLAALERMAPDSAAPVHLICCIRDGSSAPWWKELRRHEERLPQLRLTLLVAEENEVLSPDMLNAICRDLPRNTVLYMCGPEGLKAMARQVWRDAGMTGRVHDERFDFRGAMDAGQIVTAIRPLLAAGMSAIRRWRAHDPA